MIERREVYAQDVSVQLCRPYKFGEFIDFSNCDIIGDLELDGKRLCGCDFSGSRFLGTLKIVKTIFRGLSWFKGATFRKNVNFSHTRFTNDARFDGTRFRQIADFYSVEFHGVAVLDAARFEVGANFSNTIFNANLSATGTDFNRPADFSGSILMGGLWSVDSPIDKYTGLDPVNIHGRVEFGSILLSSSSNTNGK